ncbi:MAG: restriction endonuclease subunit S, partial [Gemmatimonadota bacterium]
METKLSAAAPSDWRVSAIEDVCIRVTSGGTPSRSDPSYYSGGTWPWVKTQELRDGWMDDAEEHITDEAVNSSSAKILPQHTILLAMYGATVGQLGILRRPMTCNQACSALIVDPEKADFRFLYYQLLYARAELRSLATGAAQQNLSGALIKSLLFPFPSLAEQRAIAHILGTLDDKIELNLRMSETVEAMARALFKSWFVDFDPVRAKAEGRSIGLPKSLANGFPSQLVDSEHGEIPKGWQIASLSDCIEVARGLSYKGSGLSGSEDGIPMHNLNSIYEGGGYKHDGIKHYQGDFEAHHVVCGGDVIVANTEQGHDRLLIGFAAVVPSRFGPESLFSHHIYRVRRKPGAPLPPDYLCHLLNSDVMHDIVSGYANGTTVNMLPIDALQRPAIVVPPPAITAAFNHLAQAMRLRNEEMVEESRSLGALRAALLPKLISGDIRVPNAVAR